LPKGLRAVGISEADLPTLASAAMAQQRLLMNNPLPIDEAQALDIYRAAY